VGGVRDDDVSGSQLRATNVIIETVPTESGGIAEGSAEYIESITLGSGPAWILRNGKVEAGTWNRAAYGDVVQYRFPDGKTMTLEPGNTWIEVVPNHDYPVSIQH
jgi:hypothetical protein